MPRATSSDSVVTAAAPRAARPRRAKPKPLDPVLALFARYAECSQQSATPAPVDPAPPALIDESPPPAPPSRLIPWLPIAISALAIVVAIAAAIGPLTRLWHDHGPQPNPAHAAILHYAALCDSEIVEPLRTANDGTLTGEAALKLIETARPVIQRHTWSDLADQLTALQDKDGQLPQAETAAFLDSVSTGLRSVR